MNKLSENEQKELDGILEAFHDKIDGMANRAVDRCLKALKKRFPKRRFRADFYNGDSIYRVDDKYISIMWNPSSESVVWDQPNGRGKIIPASWDVDVNGARVNPLLFEELCVLEDELILITDGFSRGCPNAFDTGKNVWYIPTGVTP